MTAKEKAKAQYEKLCSEYKKSLPQREFGKMVYMLDLARSLKSILKQRGISQKELAKKVGASEPEVSRWLNGRHNFTLNTVFKICNALNLFPGNPVRTNEQEDSMMFVYSIAA